jgi:hypothetical protein
MRPHYKTRECMMTPTILHLIRTIALMVLGWLPIHLGGTGNDQPQSPTWNIVDQPPYPQIILGYTNETLWYPWDSSRPLYSPWYKTDEGYLLNNMKHLGLLSDQQMLMLVNLARHSLVRASHDSQHSKHKLTN